MEHNHPRGVRRLESPSHCNSSSHLPQGLPSGSASHLALASGLTPHSYSWLCSRELEKRMRICISQVERNPSGRHGQLPGWERDPLCNQILYQLKTRLYSRGLRTPGRPEESNIYCVPNVCQTLCWVSYRLRCDS